MVIIFSRVNLTDFHQKEFEKDRSEFIYENPMQLLSQGTNICYDFSSEHKKQPDKLVVCLADRKRFMRQYRGQIDLATCLQLIYQTASYKCAFIYRSLLLTKHKPPKIIVITHKLGVHSFKAEGKSKNSQNSQRHKQQGAIFAFGVKFLCQCSPSVLSQQKNGCHHFQQDSSNQIFPQLSN